MDKPRISLRRADISDAKLLYRWAMDSTVRENAFLVEGFSYESHLDWYRRKLADKSCLILIGTIPDSGDKKVTLPDRGRFLEKTPDIKAGNGQGAMGTPVGQLRLDMENGVALIDYSVDPSFRGRGYGKELLGLLEDLWDESPDTGVSDPDKHLKLSDGLWDKSFNTLRGLVRTKNKASIKAFEAAGFKRTGEGVKDNMPYYEYTKKRAMETIKKTVLICTIKSWNIRNAQLFANKYAACYDIYVITDKEGLTKEAVDAIKPDIICFPHWSFYIPESIYKSYECVVFHMCDLPYGRGGSPLQNLIVRGHKDTKISALRVEKDLDAGPVYIKEPLTLEGSADEILKRASDIIFEKMIPVLVKGGVEPIPQSGKAVLFERRKPSDGELTGDMDIDTIYDYIRMLDGEGYPPAFMKFNDNYVIEFSKVSRDGDDLIARVRFRKNRIEP